VPDSKTPDDTGEMIELGSLMLSEKMGPMIGLLSVFRDLPVPEQLMILSRITWMLNRYQLTLEAGGAVADAMLFDIVAKQRKDLN